jgi:Domain of unknown function (DUF5666)
MKIALAVIVAIVLIGAAGFGGYTMGHAAGLTDAQNIRGQFFQQRGGQGGGNGQFGQGGQGGQNGQGGGQSSRRPTAFGTVKSVQGNTIELTAADGSTVTVSTSAQTTVQKTDTGALSDIKPGDRISVAGNESNGSVTATEISILATGQ